MEFNNYYIAFLDSDHWNQTVWLTLYTVA